MHHIPAPACRNYYRGAKFGDACGLQLSTMKINLARVYIHMCKERWIWLLGIPEVPAVRCILPTLYQSKLKKCEPMKMLRQWGLHLWPGTTFRRPSAFHNAPHSQEEWNPADSNDCKSSCENLALVKKSCLPCCIVVKDKKPTHPPTHSKKQTKKRLQNLKIPENS